MCRNLSKTVYSEKRLSIISPIYFYSMTSQLKILLDRCYALIDALTGKEFYYIISCAADFITYMAIILGTNFKTVKRHIKEMDNVRYVRRETSGYWEIII